MKKLERSEMKNLKGGLGDCFAQGPNTLAMFSGSNALANARDYAAASGMHWCCASCSTATWMQQYYRY